MELLAEEIYTLLPAFRLSSKEIVPLPLGLVSTLTAMHSDAETVSPLDRVIFWSASFLLIISARASALLGLS